MQPRNWGCRNLKAPPGEQLLVELGGFSADVRRLVRSHHERLDGGGYPDGRRGDELGLETRILTVCDVYDALISTRVYREAWSQGQALAQLRTETGSAFDPRCVAALEEVLAGEESTRPVPRPVPAGARVAYAG